ncbi:MAG: argininosuccinate lyase [Candidatus Omnitrophota bacterium]
MKKPVWQSPAKGSAWERFVAFSAGRDVRSIEAADSILVPYDIWTNQAHAIGLQRIGVFTQAELKKILAALAQLHKAWTRGEWKLNPALEDVHINIEAYVTEQAGEELGGRLHSGRSRNDQVAADMLLYARDVILAFIDEIAALADSLLSHANEHLRSVMPGYTHHRKATITTWGHWCAAYAQGLLRDAQAFADLYRRIDSCPLGAAAAYGTTWPLDRRFVSDLLAFDSMRENTLDAVASRGEAEAEIAHALSMLMRRLSGISQDLILFSTEEFGYLYLPSSFTTGSSIMPQKRNPDFAEAIKGKSYVVQGYSASLLSLNSCNLSGYNKDAQWSKYLFLDAVRESSGAALILADVVCDLGVNKERMEAAARAGFLNAVDMADHLARSRSLPFRKTYHVLSEAVGQSEGTSFVFESFNELLKKNEIAPLTQKEFDALQDPVSCLMSRRHLGSPNPAMVKRHLTAMQRQWKKHKQWMEKERRRIQEAKEKCASGQVVHFI